MPHTLMNDKSIRCQLLYCYLKFNHAKVKQFLILSDVINELDVRSNPKVILSYEKLELV